MNQPINWSKTEFMFICDKQNMVLPSSIMIDGNDVKVVSSFRLLGVILDNKLNFNAHVSATCSLINRKLFSIKRLFYLATSVKMQFFKSFILPYIDYCLSLSVYFPKATLQKLCTCIDFFIIIIFGRKILLFLIKLNRNVQK